MSIEYFTQPFNGDGRLKVLWFDDQAHREDMLVKETRTRLDWSLHYTPWLAITSAGDIEDLQQLRQTEVGRGDSKQFYERTGAPYDIYLLDFRLCDAKDNCRRVAHQDGAHADAAGLLAGMFTALQWPNHPQAVIPYSAHPEEAGDVWKLCWQFRTDGVVLTDFETMADKKAFTALLDQNVPIAYRRALAESLASGKAAIPTGERQRLQKLLQESGDWVDGEEQISIQTSYGLREFKMGSLFFEQLEEIDGHLSVPTKTVADLLRKPQKSDPIVRRAHELADLFWTLRLTEASHSAYGAINDGKTPPSQKTVPWIGDPTWRPNRGANSVDGVRTIRLAIIFLLVSEFRIRAMDIGIKVSEIHRRVAKALNSLRHGEFNDKLIEDLAEDAPAAHVALLELIELDQSTKRSGSASGLDWLALSLPIVESDLVQLLDPIPRPRAGKWEPSAFATSLNKEEKIGAGLVKLLDGKAVGAPEKTINLGALLTADAAMTRSMLLEEEWQAAREFARTMFSAGEMPAFLSDPS